MLHVMVLFGLLIIFAPLIVVTILQLVWCATARSMTRLFLHAVIYAGCAFGVIWVWWILGYAAGEPGFDRMYLLRATLYVWSPALMPLVAVAGWRYAALRWGGDVSGSVALPGGWLGPTHCPRCEYDLRGLPNDHGRSTCPECGERIMMPPIAPPPRITPPPPRESEE